MLKILLRVLLAVFVATFGIFFLFVSPAGALVLAGVDTTPDLRFDLSWANFLVGSIIPLVTGYLTPLAFKYKGLVTFVLSGVSAGLVQLIDNGGSLPLVQFLTAFFAVAVTAQVTYRQVWERTLAPVAQRNGVK